MEEYRTTNRNEQAANADNLNCNKSCCILIPSQWLSWGVEAYWWVHLFNFVGPHTLGVDRWQEREGIENQRENASRDWRGENERDEI